MSDMFPESREHASKLITPEEAVVGTSDLQPVSEAPESWREGRGGLVGLSPSPVVCDALRRVVSDLG